LVNKLYKQILLYNKLVGKLNLVSGIVNINMSNTGELKGIRKELMDTMRVLGEKDINVEGLLNTFNKNIKNKIILDS